VRVALITEAAYPFRASGVSGWCHQLVTGLSLYDYRLVALTGPAHAPAPAYPLPRNVSGLSVVPIHGAPAATGGRLARHRARRAATRAAVLLCRGLLGDDPHHAGLFRDGLAQLAGVAAGGGHPLAGTPLAGVLADAWRVSGGGVGRLSLRDAAAAAALLEHALRPLAVAAPPVDICHPTSGGLPLLVALAARWRAGIPYLLTEQGIYLRERYLDYGAAWPGPVKEVVLGFFRALSRLGYAEAAAVAPATRFDQRWQLRHGAHPGKVVVVPGGADPAAFPVRPEDPAAPPTVAWVGRIEPLKDLHTLVDAFWRVRQELPRAQLRLVGPTADQGYEVTCRALVRRLGLARCVSFAGPARCLSDVHAAAHVVARSSISEGMPYPVVEAMLTGRATVSTEVGGVAELVGDTGLLVPPGDPAALATALVELLRDPARRQALGQAAAQRARSFFTLDRMLRAYHRLYTDVAHRTATGAG
jgi:glycosyltransferase involved in cell wall biosynthesis